uniref:Cytochrome b6/f complex subunit V n=1 Tax=Chenopodium album TaxID=3559 RepID=A0A291S7Z7_CHEAL|nr:cytochrome b6/f complex subunit V [Chenopodium album]
MIEVFLFGIVLGLIPITLAGLFVRHIYNTDG